MLVSVVTGTFNRLASLIRMVESARTAIPLGVPYEFVIVDGGSKDGTLQWCGTQRDIRLIEHGALHGAIRAFCDGAKAATSEYVILANDDISFAPSSIMRALVHLETNPSCGAVALMDNRPLLTVPPERRGDYKAQLMPAMRMDGESTQVVYAQVGMYRRDLGNACGWWGADDPVMSQAKTYGGDNYLSAKIWEAGYTVEIVDGAQVDDHLVPDTLRERNTAFDDKAYQKVYPAGPLIDVVKGTIDVATFERPRVLYMPIYEPERLDYQRQNKRGLRDALGKRCLVWEWDYLNAGIRAEDLRVFAPHLILTQFHDGRWTELVKEMRELMPGALIVNWNGDARGLTEPAYLNLLRGIDLQLVVNAAPLDTYQANGINAAFWEIGYETWDDAGAAVPVHDVVFLANAYNQARHDMEPLLADKFNVGFYGRGWQNTRGDCLYDFTTGAALYRSAKIALSDTFSDGKTDVKAFVSNRLFQALAAGAFVLQQRSPGLEQYTGLKAGVHYVEWARIEDLPALIEQYLGKDDERARIASAGQVHVLANFSFDVQVEKLFTELLPLVEVQRATV